MHLRIRKPTFQGVMLTSLVLPISRTLSIHGMHITVCKQIQKIHQQDHSTGLRTVTTISSGEGGTSCDCQFYLYSYITQVAYMRCNLQLGMEKQIVRFSWPVVLWKFQFLPGFWNILEIAIAPMKRRSGRLRHQSTRCFSLQNWLYQQLCIHQQYTDQETMTLKPYNLSMQFIKNHLY